MRLLLCLLLCIGAIRARRTPSYSEWLGNEPDGDLWAVLIAGSAGFGNYRHQADVAHAYQVLRRGGVQASRIITMMYDDVAHHTENPHRGKLFNRPGGRDVYGGVHIDYRGQRVNAKNFLAVLAGDQNATDNGAGRVLQTTPSDRVFVFYSDHGAPGILGMPAGPFLYADQLIKVLRERARHGAFKEMVLYVEACESGSIFEGLLEDDLDIYATTAANAHESSWGTYCPGMNPSPPPEFNTCLGDLYSVAWMENSDSEDLTQETLKKQFQLVKARTSHNFTYVQGSHVMRFGTLDIDEQPVANYMGEKNTGGGVWAREGVASGGDTPPWTTLEAVPQRDADLLYLFTKYTRAEGEAKVDALRELNAEVAKRAELDGSMRAAVRALLQRSNALGLLQARYPGQDLLSLLVTQQLPREEGAPLVQDWDCLRAMFAAWEGACGALDQYGMQYSRTFANLCNSGLRPGALQATLHTTCPPRGGQQGPQVASY